MSCSLVLCHAICALTCVAGQPPVEVVIEKDAAAAAVSDAKHPLPNTPGDADSLLPAVKLKQVQVLNQLRLQATLREAKELVGQRKFAAAIERLEPYLQSADGCDSLLETLEAAYRGQLAILVEERKTDEARLIAERLRIIAPASAGETIVRAPVTAAAKTAPPTPTPTPPPTPSKPASSVPDEAVPVAAVTKTPPMAPEPEPPAVAAAQVAEKPAATAEAPKGKAEAPKDTAEAPKGIPVARPASSKPKPEYEVRAKLDEPAEPVSARTEEGDIQGMLKRAADLFRHANYSNALSLYEHAYDLDPIAVQSDRERWGYCLLWVTTARYNKLLKQDGNEAAWTTLESDVRLACRLDPTWQSYGEKMLSQIAQQKEWLRSKTAPAPATASERPPESSAAETVATSLAARQSAVAVRHLRGRSGAWSVAETPNFRIFHRNAALAEEVAQLAEQAREKAHRKWFGNEPLDNWSPRCDLYLYPTAQEYGSATGVGLQSPGHSKVLNDNGRIISRNLFMRCDDANMKGAVLPHEVAHVVFAGRFGAHSVPRWADEGMAVLTEPEDKEQAHLRNLMAICHGGNAMGCGYLMTAQEYPPGAQMRDFYATSVGLCRYLVNHGGEQKLITLLRTALSSGNYDSALRQVYGINGVSQLDAEFQQFAGSLGGHGAAVAGLQLVARSPAQFPRSRAV